MSIHINGERFIRIFQGLGVAQAAVTERWPHISSSYAKILGETNFCTREIPRSGSKAKDGGEKRNKERERD